MITLTKYQIYAQSLLVDIGAVTANLLFRREVLLGWLEDFATRAARKDFRIEPVEVENLIALDKYVRVNHIPATSRAALD